MTRNKAIGLLMAVLCVTPIVARSIPEMQYRQHEGTIEGKYDHVEDRSTLRLRLEFDADQSCRLRITAWSTHAGQSRQQDVREVNLSFQRDHAFPRYLLEKNHDVVLATKRQRVTVPAGEKGATWRGFIREHVVVNGRPVPRDEYVHLSQSNAAYRPICWTTETVLFSVPFDQLLGLIETNEQITIRVGSRDLELDRREVDALRDFASRLRKGMTIEQAGRKLQPAERYPLELEQGGVRLVVDDAGDSATDTRSSTVRPFSVLSVEAVSVSTTGAGESVARVIFDGEPVSDRYGFGRVSRIFLVSKDDREVWYSSRLDDRPSDGHLELTVDREQLEVLASLSAGCYFDFRLFRWTPSNPQRLALRRFAQVMLDNFDERP